jgi:hypothetical protein
VFKVLRKKIVKQGDNQQIEDVYQATLILNDKLHAVADTSLLFKK